ncbi:hypothetical protein V8F33_011973 [Rhypophila sp. PSN 637]
MAGVRRHQYLPRSGHTHTPRIDRLEMLVQFGPSWYSRERSSSRQWGQEGKKSFVMVAWDDSMYRTDQIRPPSLSRYCGVHRMAVRRVSSNNEVNTLAPLCESAKLTNISSPHGVEFFWKNDHGCWSSEEEKEAPSPTCTSDHPPKRERLKKELEPLNLDKLVAETSFSSLAAKITVVDLAFRGSSGFLGHTPIGGYGNTLLSKSSAKDKLLDVLHAHQWFARLTAYP